MRLKPFGHALAAATVAVLAGAVGLVAHGGGAGASQVSATALPNNWYGSAPYVMPLDNDPPDIAEVMAATGQRAFLLAFILAPSGGGCAPTWDGRVPVSTDTAVAGVVNTIRAAGGDVMVAAGGAAGTKLGQTCATPAATAAAYQQVIDKYDLAAIDFDLEEPEIENATAINNELGAAQILQRTNPGLYVSVTMPTIATGANFFGQLLLNNARALGFTPNNYAIMPFDGGFAGAGAQIAALEAFHGQLMTTFGWDSATAYAHEGVSLMNGRSDVGEFFPQSAFQTVLDYATGHGLSRYTFWSVNRDRQCTPPDNNGRTSGTCSSVPQAPWEFTRFTVRFAGATPPATPPPTTPPPPGTCTAAAWNPSTAYVGGSLVTHAEHTWRARWWTQGETPGTAEVWTDQGPCTGGGGSLPAPGGCTAAAWNATTAYVGGSVVTHNGRAWQARWWTQGDIPGNNAQAVWTDLGSCTG